jgi:hypothetical protein
VGSHTPTLCRNSHQRGGLTLLHFTGTRQALPSTPTPNREGGLTLLHSARTPTRGEYHTPTLCRHSCNRGVLRSYTQQELLSEGSLTLLHSAGWHSCQSWSLKLLNSAGTPPKGESHTPTLSRHSLQRGVSHSYTLQELSPEEGLILLHSAGTLVTGESHIPKL